MRRWDWQIKLGIVLIILSAIVYFVHYLIFRDPHHKAGKAEHGDRRFLQRSGNGAVDLFL